MQHFDERASDAKLKAHYLPERYAIAEGCQADDDKSEIFKAEVFMALTIGDWAELIEGARGVKANIALVDTAAGQALIGQPDPECSPEPSRTRATGRTRGSSRQ